MENILSFVEKFSKLYPDLMVLDRKDEFERIKLAGKVELLNEMRAELKKKENDSTTN